MELYNIITKVPYIIMLGVGLTLVLQIFIGGLTSISDDVRGNSDLAYDVVIASEQMHNLDDRRSVIDVSHIGEGSDYDCSISEIENLDDEYLSYRVQTDVMGSGIDCQDSPTASGIESLRTRILVEQNDELVPMSLEVYEE